MSTSQDKMNMGKVTDFEEPSSIEDCDGKLSEFDNKTFVVTNAEPYFFKWEGEEIKGIKATIDGKVYYTSRKVIVDQLERMMKGFSKGLAFKVQMIKPKGKKYYVLEDA